MNTVNALLQRAALMGLITAILDDQEEKTLNQIKERITDTITRLIDMEAVVGDSIEVFTINSLKRYLEQEIAVDQVKDLLK